jgi:3-methyladenine DNA glycosylase Tag
MQRVYNARMAKIPMQRCPWAITDLAVRYHDQEWGVPVHDDRLLLEL